ncbi:MAG TPA: FRG domain-containing protein [Erysipelotrichaceae bacterium]|nr:FRG domain-containing protein [Erysipelotrichaceae bacterium]
MITVRTITKIDELGPIIFDQEFNKDLNRFRSRSLYKGLSNAQWHLSTSLYRNCMGKKNELEGTILRSFTKYASFEDPALKDSVWRQLIIGQHHGLPTRMLDWTYSPLIAMHFATSAEPVKLGSRDALLWKIDGEELNERLPDKYRRELRNSNAHMYTVEMLERVTGSLREYDLDMKDHAMVLMEPPSIDQRIINQYASFAIIPEGIEKADGSGTIEQWLDQNTENTVKYIIDKDIIWRVRDMLDQMNINERLIYPGLDGLSQWLMRRYYVTK